MKIVRIPKPGKPGKFRTLYCPDPTEKRKLKAIVPQLNLIAEELDKYSVSHGFTEHRSPVTNAKVHIGFEFTVSFDLSEFFDHVSESHVFIGLGDKGKTFRPPPECFVDGAARQGLPTSPALANIAASPMDREIVERFCLRKGRFTEAPAVFSRYADDLTFSTRTMATVDLLLQEVPKIVSRHGFSINPSKTRVQAAKAGKRVICGVSVGDTGISIPRYVRRKIRAADHQVKNGLKNRGIRRLLMNRHRWRVRLPLKVRQLYQLNGLKEWAKLKLPEGSIGKPSMVAVAVHTVTHAAQAVIHCQAVTKVMGYFGRKFS